MRSYDIRRFEDNDWPAVLDLMRLSLGWRDGDPNEELFRWKHRDNPFGPSPAWVAVDGGQVIGFRTFMRWEFEDGGRVVRAVRAVDTATHPEHQGRGIFKRLTLQALDELREQGVEFIFNTPNQQSRPGYLKMGWSVIGRPRVAVVLTAPTSILALSRARTPADLESLAAEGGQAAAAFLKQIDEPALASLLPQGPTMRTRRTLGYFRWRYSLPHLRYRVFPLGTAADDGFVVARLRRRGAAVEAVLCDVASRRPITLTAGRKIAEALGADYALALGLTGRRWLPVPRQGPVVTRRNLNPGLKRAWNLQALTMGDVELF